MLTGPATTGGRLGADGAADGTTGVGPSDPPRVTAAAMPVPASRATAAAPATRSPLLRRPFRNGCATTVLVSGGGTTSGSDPIPRCPVTGRSAAPAGPS